MNKTFASDLNNAREESALTLEDTAQLIGVPVARYRRLERGNAVPKLKEICALSVLFNQAFESLYNDVFDEVKSHMAAALENLPSIDAAVGESGTRLSTLNALAERLQTFCLTDYDV